MHRFGFLVHLRKHFISFYLFVDKVSMQTIYYQRRKIGGNESDSSDKVEIMAGVAGNTASSGDFWKNVLR